jgi:hypothetical protein
MQRGYQAKLTSLEAKRRSGFLAKNCVFGAYLHLKSVPSVHMLVVLQGHTLSWKWVCYPMQR